jgi:hypothetical protein
MAAKLSIFNVIKAFSLDRALEYAFKVAITLIEIAQKMAQAARAGVAVEKKRLREIIAARQAKPASPSR